VTDVSVIHKDIIALVGVPVVRSVPFSLVIPRLNPDIASKLGEVFSPEELASVGLDDDKFLAILRSASIVNSEQNFTADAVRRFGKLTRVFVSSQLRDDTIVLNVRFDIASVQLPEVADDVIVSYKRPRTLFRGNKRWSDSMKQPRDIKPHELAYIQQRLEAALDGAAIQPDPSPG